MARRDELMLNARLLTQTFRVLKVLGFRRSLPSMSGYLKLPMPLWTLRPLQKLAKASAFVRHPRNSRKRKAYRAEQIETLELGPHIRRGPSAVPLRTSDTGRAKESLPSDVLRPSVSAIIPNYNHARYLETRIRSIAEQGLPVSELIILDDASTDDSREVIAKICAPLPFPVTTVFNEINSGSIFQQWTKGLNLAKGDLIWICESDDSCDPRFLQSMVPNFYDPSVMLAFGRIAFIDADDNLLSDKNGYLDRSQFWSERRTESAFAWFNGPFGARNIIANVGGCIFRRQEISAELQSELYSYKICGDWFLYSCLARGGRIAYEPGARAYFRQHDRNSSVASHKSAAFYDEHIRIAKALRRHYGLEGTTLQSLLQNAWMQCSANLGDEAAKAFARRNPLKEILRERRRVQHVLVTMPKDLDPDATTRLIQNTNELSSRGSDVTILLHGSIDDAAALRGKVSSAVPILSDEILQAQRPESLLNTYGVSSLISNAPGADGNLVKACRNLNVPYSTAFNI